MPLAGLVREFGLIKKKFLPTKSTSSIDKIELHHRSFYTKMVHYIPFGGVPFIYRHIIYFELSAVRSLKFWSNKILWKSKSKTG